MTVRIRSDFWAAAYLRRCASQNAPAVLRRRGSPEAGAIFIVVDRLDGTASLYGPAPQSEVDDGGVHRRFERVHKDESIASADVERRLQREMSFDPDLWIVEVENRAGRAFLD